MLSQLKSICGNSIGLYRDDGLAVSHEPPRSIERIKKRIAQLFADYGLKITIDANKKIVNYLDVTLDLNTIYACKEQPPPSILRRIPESVNQRLSDISSDESVFNKATPPYQAALDKSGYQHTLKFHPRENRRKKRRLRKRKVTWFNPPFDARVKTNLGKEFLRIINKCFPRGHALRPIFNRSTLMFSYGCMPNVKSVIDSKDKRLLLQSGAETLEERLCNYATAGKKRSAHSTTSASQRALCTRPLSHLARELSTM